jgi:iron complex transport system permease protein
VLQPHGATPWAALPGMSAFTDLASARVRWPLAPRRRAALVLTGLGLLLAIAFIATIALAPEPLTPFEIVAAVAHRLGLGANAGLNQVDEIVLAVRLPRAVLALSVGAALGAAGAAMQGLFRNPLADPGLIGVSSGAAFGAVATMVLGAGVLDRLPADLRPWLLPLAAFGGGVMATLVVLRLASGEGRAPVATLLLAGIAINALCGAAIGLLTFFADDVQVRAFLFWTMGSLGNAAWSTVLPALPLLILPILVLARYARQLDAFALGEREAVLLGVDAERLKLQLTLLVAVLAGAAVAVCGVIGFIGLVAPHLLRLAFGPSHRLLLPASALLGGTLLAIADIVARLGGGPGELPIGVVTSLIGGPFFLWLLLRQPLRIET